MLRYVLALAAFLGVILAVGIGVTLLAFPHLVEGVTHLYGVLWIGAFAVVPCGRRDLPATLGNARSVADGYRGTKSIDAPGLRTGSWTLALEIGTGRVRLVVVDERTALVTVMARPRRPVAHIARALATIRIRLVDVGEGRRLEARLIPANLSLPLAIPAYAALLTLVNRGEGVGDAIAMALAPAIVVGVVWQGIWWAFHHAQIRASVERAMDDLEGQLAEQAHAPVA